MRASTSGLLAAVVGGVALFLAVGSAQAVTVQCPASPAATGTIKVMTLDTNPVSSCYASSDANSIPLTLAGYDFLDKVDKNLVSQNNILTITQTSTGQGTFSIAAGFTDLILALKDGNNGDTPYIEYFALGAGVLTGDWTIQEWANGVFSKYKNFSDAVLFGHISAVPLPAGLPLFASGLSGLGFLAWRKRRKSARALIAIEA